MKKYFVAALSLTGLILLIAFGCDKEEELIKHEDRTANVTVFEDPSLIDNVSPNFYDNHIYRIEVLGENQERNRVLRAATESGADMSCMDVSDVQKCYFNNTELIMYAIPGNDPEQALILYERFGLFHASLAECRQLSGSRSLYSLRTLDGAKYLSFELEEDRWTGVYEVKQNEILDNYNTQIYALTLEEGHLKTANSEEAECCRREKNWSACIDCTIEDCMSSTLCKLATIALGPYLAVGFAGSCVGAGPNTFC